MLIASLVIVAVFILFITITYFVTKKSYHFEYNGKNIKISNSSNTLKIFIDGNLFQIIHMPQLIKGESFKIKVDEQEIIVNCKSNGFGNKLSINAFAEEKEIYNNNVKIK